MRKLSFLILLILASQTSVFSQTYATDFTVDDCSGISHSLFSELDQGNVVVISWVMPCPPCATYALYAYDAVQSFSVSHPGKVHFYIADDFANTPCATLDDWVNTNNMLLSTTFSAPEIDMTDYGFPGMPKVVVLGGLDHRVYYNANESQIKFNDIQTAINDALDNTTSLNNLNKELDITLFSNPVNNNLTIYYNGLLLEDAEYTVFNILGEEVLIPAYHSTQDLNGSGMVFKVGALRPGIYFLNISSSLYIKSFQFIIN